MREWLENLRETDEHKEMIDLALLVRELAGRGDAERRICREILESVLNFSDSCSESRFLNF